MVKFKVYVDKEDLKEVNISSLLFYSDTCICDLIVGNIRASLIVNGETRIINEETGDIYKHCGAFTKEMKDLIKSHINLEDCGYIVDMSNWFEIFVDKIDENENVIEELCYEVADIEGALEEYDLVGSLFKFMVNSLKDYTNKKDFDLMLISGNEDLLIKKKVKNAYENYEKLGGFAIEEEYNKLEKQIAKLEKQIEYENRKLEVCAYGKSDLAYIDELESELEELKEKQDNLDNADEESFGREVYMNSNEKICWVEYLDNEENLKSIIEEP